MKGGGTEPKQQKSYICEKMIGSFEVKLRNWKTKKTGDKLLVASTLIY